MPSFVHSPEEPLSRRDAIATAQAAPLLCTCAEDESGQLQQWLQDSQRASLAPQASSSQAPFLARLDPLQRQSGSGTDTKPSTLTAMVARGFRRAPKPDLKAAASPCSLSSPSWDPQVHYDGSCR